MARELTRVTAVIPSDLILSAAMQAGLPGNIGKSGSGRYALARLAGHDHMEAMRVARVEREARTLQANETPTAFDVPPEILEKATQALPEGSPITRNRSYLIRYAFAKLLGYTETDAMKVAVMTPGRLFAGSDAA
jgi:hypothetical protein